MRCCMEQYCKATFTEAETDDMYAVCLLVPHAAVALQSRADTELLPDYLLYRRNI